jgi:hypothetical protein
VTKFLVLNPGVINTIIEQFRLIEQELNDPQQIKE